MLAKLVSLLKSLRRTTAPHKPSTASRQRELVRKKRVQQAARARNYINPWHNI